MLLHPNHKEIFMSKHSNNDSNSNDSNNSNNSNNSSNNDSSSSSNNSSSNSNSNNGFLFAGFGADTLSGGNGNDFLFGGEGSDTFVFGVGQGNDVIADFDVAADQIYIRWGTNGMTSTDDVLAHLRSDNYGNAVLDLGEGNSLTLMGVAPIDFSVHDFTIGF